MRSSPDAGRGGSTPGWRAVPQLVLALLGCGQSAPDPAPALTAEPTAAEAPPVAAPVIEAAPEPVAPPPEIPAPPPVPAPRLALTETRGCVIGSDGAVHCFPIGGRPPIGDAIAAAVDGLTNAVTVAALGSNVCAIDGAGQVRCVTFRYTLGTPSAARVLDTLTGVVRLALTDDGVCGLDGSGAVRCAPQSGGPAVAIELPGPATDLTSNGYEVCAALAGSMHCWGRARGPQPVETHLSGVRSVSSVHDATCALSAQGMEASCHGAAVGSWYYEDLEWEDEERGPVNAMEAPLSPGAIATLPFSARRIATAMDHACVLGETGGVACWGAAFRSGRHEGFEPRAVSGMASGVTEIAGGGGPYVGVTCALQRDVLRCFYAPSPLSDARPGARTFRVCASADDASCAPLPLVRGSASDAPSPSGDEPTPAGCVVRDESGTPLNVRADATGRAEIVGTLANDTRVQVLESRGPWRRVDGPPAGWVWNEAIACEETTR